MFGVLVVILCPDRVADLGFSTGERQAPLIVSLRVLGAVRLGASDTRFPALRAARAARARSEEKNERETRKLRCAKPSAPKSSRQRMKPILDWTKSKAEAYAPGAARRAPSRLHSVFAFSAGISETACCGRRSGSQPPFDACFGHQRSLLPTAFPNRIYVVSIQGDDVRFGS